MNSEEKRLLSDEEIDTVAGGAKSDVVEVQGIVTERLFNDTYHVQLEDGTIIKARRSGKMRTSYVDLIVGDHVTVEVIPGNTDITGRIITRAHR
ncbi:MAG: translation initiation factor IF-1 [Erysipelotrichaceae bacterium]|nr:translation initiation factor IF-1 [Erysipelotrichaceae bacterium]